MAIGYDDVGSGFGRQCSGIGMSIHITPFAADDLCLGCTWAIEDEETLALHIAQVALGQYEHVAEILHAAGLGPEPTDQDAIASAVELLTEGASVYNRDGWLFQVMSWLAAHRRTPGGLIRAPHMQHAFKGFDGLQIEIADDEERTVTAVVIFEDKATDNPRDTIRDEVWPEFQKLESGKRRSAIVAEITTLLRTLPHPNPKKAIREIVWNNAQRYRVSITVEERHLADTGRKSLFAGYDRIVPGAADRRRGEMFYVQDLRPWLARVATLAISKAQAMAGLDV